MATGVPIVQGSSFQWEIENALTINSLESDEFVLCGCRWRLRLSLDILGCMNIRLEKLNSRKLNGTYVIHAFILGNNEEISNTHAKVLDNKYFKIQLIWWIDRDELRKRRDTYLADGTLTIVVVFTPRNIHEADAKGEKVSDKSIQKSVRPDTVPDLEKLSSDFHRLLDDGVQSDVTLKCGESSFPAHKIILSARSEVFSAMLQSDMTESRTGVIKISDVDSSTLHQILHYIYSGKLPDLSVDTAPKLYAAGDKYSVETLKNTCAKFMEENLTTKNAFKILVFADIYGDKNLKDAVLRFITNV